MRTLAIDYGEARTGLAITDPLGITAQGLETIYSHGQDKLILNKIDELLKTYQIDTIVVGMPLHMNGKKSQRADITEKFIHKLKCKYNTIKIDYIDERLTTVASHRTMTELGVKKDKKKSIVDMMSAVLILQMYLDKNAK